jgi:molybdate transport system substrate-binding protein
MRRFRAVILCTIGVLAGACGPSQQPGTTQAPRELIVFAAASLTGPFKEIGESFGKANGGVHVTFNFGGSQQLVQQLSHGAPADVFASANHKQMDTAVDAGRVEKETARSFVRNRLVVVTPKDNPGHVAKLKDLSKSGLKVILAAKEVPVGQYALEVLDNVEKAGSAGFKEAVLKNVVSYEQDVKAVLVKVTLGEADAGVVYTSDISLEARDKVASVEVPDAVNVIASYPIAAVKDSKQADLAKKFVEYVRSPAAQTVLVRYGFISTTGSASGEAPAAEPVEVSGRVAATMKFGTEDLAKLDQIEAPDGGKLIKGVSIAILLDKAGVKSNATTVALVGGDGYRKELTLEELRQDAQAIVTAAENGSVRSVVPSKGPGYSVKGLVKLEVS